jgi:hypothetical protein
MVNYINLLRNFFIFSILFILILILTLNLFNIMYVLPYYDNPENSNKFGWGRMYEFIDFENIEDSKGNFRTIKIEYFKHGFKRWPTIDNNSKNNVLILGDSYTEMNYVNNGEEWYSYIEKEFYNYDFYVYGSRGYSTLQEYLVFNEYIDEINPKFIILQFDSNDFIHNYYPSSKRDFLSNSIEPRPYLINGSIQYRLSGGFEKIKLKSRFVRYFLNIFNNIKRIVWLKNFDIYKKRLIGEGSKFSEYDLFSGKFNESLNITSQIFSMFRNKSNEIPIVIFTSDDVSTNELIKITNSSSFHFIKGFDDYLYKFNYNDIIIPNDGHWNTIGNKIVGEYLIYYFKENHLIEN